MARVGDKASTINHPLRWIAGSVIAFEASAWVAIQQPVPAWELDLTTTINSVPDVVAGVTWAPMQTGALAAPMVIGASAWVLGRRRLASTVAISGMSAWLLAKGVKEAFHRDRPLMFLPELHIRDGDGSGLGFVSGHSAVAAACAICVGVALPRRWRPIAALAAVLAGVARIVHGVHLPADVVGGWALGVAVGVTAMAVLDER